MDTLIVMGNGPSLKQVNWRLLDRVHTFGLNAAYRAYERLDWWPTYHGCFDYIVNISHGQAFYDAMEHGRCKRHFFLQPELAHDKATIVKLDRRPNPQALGTGFDPMPDMGNSGANASQVGVILGYKRIVLVGVDCRYVEQVEGSTEVQGHLAMIETPKTNPNYWFDDYQQAGDHYNKPRTDVFQLPGWERFGRLASALGVEVFNCSEGSALKCFPFAKLEDVI